MAVMRIGMSRSRAPRSTASRKSVTPSPSIKCWMCDTSMIPFLVAMPNRVMNPIIDATLRTPPARNTPATPPRRARGRLSTMSIPSCHVARDDDPALYVLAQDHVRSLLTSDVREQARGNRTAVRRVDRQVGQPLEVGLRRRVELHDEIEGRGAVENPPHGRAGKA